MTLGSRRFAFKKLATCSLPLATTYMKKSTAKAGSNIAFVKYWGNADDELRIPMNGSISMTLDAAQTITTVEFSSELEKDILILNEDDAGERATARASKHLDHLRKLANIGVSGQMRDIEPRICFGLLDQLQHDFQRDTMARISVVARFGAVGPLGLLRVVGFHPIHKPQ